METSNKKVDISIIVPIVERYDDLGKLFVEFSEPLCLAKKSFEFIFVVDAQFQNAYEDLRLLQQEFSNIRVIKFARNFHESIALMAGFEHAQGNIIVTLSAYFQVDPVAVTDCIAKLSEGYDLVITRRHPRKDSFLNRIQTAAFHGLVNRMTGTKFKDIACGLRAMTREVAESLEITGDMHRFIPVLAHQKGFKIAEIVSPQRDENRNIRIFSPGIYVRRIIDIISLFFLMKFTRKPLRFFGLIGVNCFIVGTAILGYLGFVRLAYNEAIGGRPILLLGLLLFALGVQVASIGLIGELIIFTHAREIKEYHVAEIL